MATRPISINIYSMLMAAPDWHHASVGNGWVLKLAKMANLLCSTLAFSEVHEPISDGQVYR